jgi:DNA-binding MarR family transcriptional regulator
MTDLKRIFDDLVRFETTLWDAVDARLRGELGLPMGSFDPMQIIGRTTPCRVQDIASRLSITVGGASKAVDRIEANGYCLRRSNPDDRRSSIIELTPRGERLLAEATVVFERELETRISSLLAAGALEQLGASLATLRSGSA